MKEVQNTNDAESVFLCMGMVGGVTQRLFLFHIGHPVSAGHCV